METAAIDDAMVATLQTDPALAALCPDGVFWDVAPHGSKAFVIISLVTQSADAVFGGRAIETTIYAVKAVIVNGAGDIAAAAARIDALLDEGTLTIPGATFMAMHRDDDNGRIRYTEFDDQNKSIRWQHRGSRYRVEVSLSAALERTRS